MNSFRFTPLFGSTASTVVCCLLLLAAFLFGLVHYLRNRASSDVSVVVWIRRGLIAILLMAAVSGPSIVSQTNTQAVNGTDVFFAVDVTGSMAVEDAHYGTSQKITRLESAQKTVSDLVSMYSGASYAAVSFGANASLDVPLTPDARAIRNWSENLSAEPTGVSSGSSLDAPLDTLLRSMQKAHEARPNNLIVLYYISDGEKTSSAERRTFSSLRAFVQAGGVLAAGSTAGGNVPLVESSTSDSPAAAQGNDEQQWVTDPSNGKPALSQLDPTNLKDIADELSVPYVQPSATTTAAQLKATISHQYSLLSTHRKRTRVTWLIWPIGIGLFALILWEFGSAINKQRRYL